jgi:hypothetical protein
MPLVINEWLDGRLAPMLRNEVDLQLTRIPNWLGFHSKGSVFSRRMQTGVCRGGTLAPSQRSVGSCYSTLQ